MKNNNKRRAMTLVELLIATFIVVLVMGGLIDSILTIVCLSNTARDETVATFDLRNMMEKLRATPFDGVVELFPDANTDGPPNNPYADIVGNYTLDTEHISVTYANVNSDPLEINVELSWRDKIGRPHSLSASTFRTR